MKRGDKFDLFGVLWTISEVGPLSYTVTGDGGQCGYIRKDMAEELPVDKVFDCDGYDRLRDEGLL